MAKLLSIAIWPEGNETHAEYPLEFELQLQAGESPDWITCLSTVRIQRGNDLPKDVLLSQHATVLRRDLTRLAEELKSLLSQSVTQNLTFVPVIPSFEIWFDRLSDDQYRVMIWLDMADLFDGINEIAYRGFRFISSRTRLMGFARSMESDLRASG